MSKSYQKALQIVFERNFNAEEIVRKLAIEHPALFVKYATTFGGSPVMSAMEKKLREIMKYDPQSNYVAAVREYRAVTGNGLKEAVDFVRPIKEQMLLERT